MIGRRRHEVDCGEGRIATVEQSKLLLNVLSDSLRQTLLHLLQISQFLLVLLNCLLVSLQLGNVLATDDNGWRAYYHLRLLLIGHRIRGLLVSTSSIERHFVVQVGRLGY